MRLRENFAMSILCDLDDLDGGGTCNQSFYQSIIGLIKFSVVHVIKPEIVINGKFALYSPLSTCLKAKQSISAYLNTCVYNNQKNLCS